MTACTSVLAKTDWTPNATALNSELTLTTRAPGLSEAQEIRLQKVPAAVPGQCPASRCQNFFKPPTMPSVASSGNTSTAALWRRNTWTPNRPSSHPLHPLSLAGSHITTLTLSPFLMRTQASDKVYDDNDVTTTATTMTKVTMRRPGDQDDRDQKEDKHPMGPPSSAAPRGTPMLISALHAVVVNFHHYSPIASHPTLS
ncbi:hypothetical protein EI94DRAFT_1708575 [Lactarius quietus]|nr:hypothetical protein EI94DRAFT_1708575 [Lactarius quietus]